jgi:predicted PurR-regulated permease PerM
LLAVWMAICNPMPQIGGFLGAVPFVAFGLSESAVVGVACLVVFLIYQQLENHVLQPLIIGRAVSLTPPATMVAALVGVAAGGVVGGILAIPLLGATKAIYLSLRSPDLEIAGAAWVPPSEELPTGEPEPPGPTLETP